MNAGWDSGGARVDADVPAFDALTRERLGRQMQQTYESVVDEPLDPRLAELLHALKLARDAPGRRFRASRWTTVRDYLEEPAQAQQPLRVQQC